MVLHGRARECTAIDTVLDGARRSASGCLALRGEPGIGKSALLAYAAERASDGFAVLRAAGTPAESGMPYAGLQQLLRPALGGLDALPGVQAAALAGALGLASGDGVDRFLIGLATLSLLSEHAEAVLALVDDLQWLDPESADTLRFAARRLDAEGIALLVAGTRPSEMGRELELIGLDRMAGDSLLLELAEATPAVRAFVWEQTHGNPSAVIEVAGALTPEQLAGSAPLPEGIALQHTLVARAARLPEVTREMLLVAAAEGSGDTAVILRAAGALGLGPAALEPAELAGIVRVAREGLVFRAPPMRTAIYEDAPFGRRQAAHRAIADALGDGEADRRAWHRSAATVGPDDEVADELERSAERARSRGGHAAAAATLERAADLASDDRVTGRRLATAAGAALLAGRAAHAGALAERAARLVDDPGVLAELDFTRARVMAGAANRGVGFELMLASADAVAATQPVVAAQRLGEAGRLAWMDADPKMLLAVGRRMDALALDDDAPERFAVELMKALLRGEVGAASLDGLDPDDPQQLHLAGVVSMFARDDRTARDLLARALARTRELGSVTLLPRVLVPAALLETWDGAYPAARSHAAEGERLAHDTGQDHLLAYFVGVQAWIAAVRGEDAAELVARALSLGHAQRVRPAVAIAVWAAALSELGAGQWAEAATRLEAVVPAGAPDHHPAIALQASADLAEAAVRAERPELAREIADADLGAVAPWACALTARARGLAAADDDAAVAEFEAALAHHAAGDRRFEEARTRLAYGERLRRLKQRRAARTQLRAAIDVFERLGAAPWEQRARNELRATGETARKRDPSTLDQLTPQELQIVRLVAEGATNKAIGAQLFISPRTVAYHLRNVFVKLGISSRAELIRFDELR